MDRHYNRISTDTGLYRPRTKETIDDGFGSVWSAWCPLCGKKSLVVIRPGKIQCNSGLDDMEEVKDG
jgi:hypothetical protein